VLDAAVITAGSVATQLAIPDTLALAQQSLREQVVALELGAGGAIAAVTATNALLLTIGSL
jgi:hypothetical protein